MFLLSAVCWSWYRVFGVHSKRRICKVFQGDECGKRGTDTIDHPYNPHADTLIIVFVRMIKHINFAERASKTVVCPYAGGEAWNLCHIDTMVIFSTGLSWKPELLIMGSKWVMYVVNSVNYIYLNNNMSLDFQLVTF